jgi:hypothetical protein
LAAIGSAVLCAEHHHKKDGLHAPTLLS